MEHFETLYGAEAYCELNGAKFHHYATRKGYRSTCRYDDNPKPFSVEPYEGKFGKGYIISLYNALGFNGRRSNNYYQIEYFIIG